MSILILGQGFVGKYLSEILSEKSVSFAATTTSGRDGTIKWVFESPESDGQSSPATDFSALPKTETIIITFPLQGAEEAKRLIEGYYRVHGIDSGNNTKPRIIYLGSTRPFRDMPSTRFTPPNLEVGGPRVAAEEYFIAEHNGQVLNLAGLWGGKRNPANWGRFLTDKDKVCARLSDRSLHLIHGKDSARAIFAVWQNPAPSAGERWLVSDAKTHDMLEIFLQDERLRGYIRELLQESKEARELLKAETIEEIELGGDRVRTRIDSSHFWAHFGIEPEHPFDMSKLENTSTNL